MPSKPIEVLSHDTVNQHVRFAYHALIAQLWVGALESGFDGSASMGQRGGAREGTYRRLWTFWDSKVPLPTRATMPFWMLACESAIGVHEERQVAVIPPLSQHLLFANLADPGYDSFIRAPIRGLMQSPPKAYANTGDRVALRKLNRLKHSPCFVVNGSQVALLNRVPTAMATGMDDGYIFVRKRQLEGIAVRPGDPFCRERIYRGSGFHLHEILHKGLIMSEPAIEGDWVDEGCAIRVGESTPMRKVPCITPPIFFGFLDSYPGGPLYDWMTRYGELREETLNRLPEPLDTALESRVLLSSLKGRLERAGRIMEPSGAVKVPTRKTAVAEKRAQAMQAFAAMMGINSDNQGL